MKLEEIRNEIDSIDKELVSLFVRRMNCAAEVAKYKEKINYPYATHPVKEPCLAKYQIYQEKIIQ